MERLRHLAQRQIELNQGLDRKHIKIPQHIEVKHNSFEVADLQKLIKQTTNDLEVCIFNNLPFIKTFQHLTCLFN